MKSAVPGRTRKQKAAKAAFTGSVTSCNFCWRLKNKMEHSS